MEERGARGPAAVNGEETPILLYDGVCGFCAGSVRLILRHERRSTLRFAPLESRAGAAIRERHPELEGVDSMVWVEPGTSGGERVLVRSDAALRIGAYLGGIWGVLAAPARLVPRPIRDAVYNAVARLRHRISGSLDACVVPAQDVRARCLE